MKIVIKGRLDGLNEYTKANRGNKYVGAKMKENNELLIRAQLPKVPTFTKRVRLHTAWYEPNYKRDPDNAVSAKKFILDALVRAKILKNDSLKYVAGFYDDVYVDRNNPRIEITFEELEEIDDDE